MNALFRAFLASEYADSVKLRKSDHPMYYELQVRGIIGLIRVYHAFVRMFHLEWLNKQFGHVMFRHYATWIARYKIQKQGKKCRFVDLNKLDDHVPWLFRLIFW